MRLEKIKQNKKTVAIFALLPIFLLSFCIPVFAYSSSSTNGLDFSSQPLPVAQYSAASVQSVGVILIPSYSSNIKIAASSDNVYCFAYKTTALNNTNKIVFASLQSGSYGYYSQNSSNVSRAPLTLSNGSLYYSDPAYHPAESAANTWAIPTFPSVEAGLAAVLDWIENPPGPAVTPHELNYVLPAGNVLFVDIEGTDFNDYYLTMSTPSYFSVSESSGFGTAIGYSGQLLTDFSLPITGTSVITWNGQGKANVAGKYNSWSYFHGASTGYKYLIIVNPFVDSSYDTQWSDYGYPSSFRYNSSITVKVDQANSAKIFPLTTQFQYVDGQGSISDSGGSDPLDVSYDTDSESWVTTDQNGLPSQPDLGGNTAASSSNNVHDFLENIANQITGFFSGAINAITTLVNSGSRFISQLSTLYSWLPPPVYSVLCAALIICITVGVIKVFL